MKGLLLLLIALTLSITGKGIVYLLDALDENHCQKSIFEVVIKD